ncbi:MAG: HEAT repeat domain-containing protein, partial [Flavobacteriales bacterium]
MKKYANQFIFSLVLISVLILNSCSNSAKKEVKNKFNDPLFVELYDAADQKDIVKIKKFLQHQRADLRTDAAWLCSYQSDTTLITPLFSLLKDSVEEVGAAAAHALGYFQLNEKQQANIELGISLEVSQKQSKHSLLLKEMMITAAKNYQPKEEVIKTVYFGGFYDEVEMTTPFEQTMFNVP